MKAALSGIFPALVTPLTETEAVAIPALERLLERVYQAGVDGVYLCGSTGEGLFLPAAERRKIVEVAARNSPRGKHVVVHVGAWSFAEAMALARHAEGAGASAISSLRPAGVSYGELLPYYRDLASATHLPFLAYYFPANASETLSYDQLGEICALPGVAGVKYTDYDLFVLSSLAREGKLVFNGRDEVLTAGLLMGACGGIGSIYNLVPECFVEIQALARAGKWVEARAVQDRVNDLIRTLVRFPFLSALKTALGWTGVECGPALRPRARLTPAQISELRKALALLDVFQFA